MGNPVISMLAWLVGMALLGWLIVSSIAVIWWYFRPKQLDSLLRDRHEGRVKALNIGAFISLATILVLGCRQILVFIPDRSWDGDEPGLRTNLATWVAVGLSAFFAYLLAQATQLRPTLDKLCQTEAKLKSAEDSRQFAEREITHLEQRIEDIMDRLEDLGVKEMYEKSEEEHEAELEAWYASMEDELLNCDDDDESEKSVLP